MDTTNLARLTTDVSIYFGSTSALCNNTISCLLICDIIFQPYVFPIRAAVPFGSFSITSPTPAMVGMPLTDSLIAEATSTETRARWGNTTLSIEKRTTKIWNRISSIRSPLEQCQREWLYNRESKRLRVAGLSLTVWCVQLGFGLWGAIFHGAQRVGAGTIFHTPLVQFLKTETIGWLQTRISYSHFRNKLLVFPWLASLLLPNDNKWLTCRNKCPLSCIPHTHNIQVVIDFCHVFSSWNHPLWWNIGHTHLCIYH